MRFGKTKWVSLNFMPYEFKGVEKYLESLALEGWKLKNIKGGFGKFEKIEPMNLKYTVDVVDEIAFIDGENTEISMEYREYCKMAGWEFICEKDKIQIYCREISGESIPIHTDERERFEVIKKASSKYEFGVLIVNLCLLYYAYKCTWGGVFLADNLILLFLSIIGIKIIIDIIQFIDFMKWKAKAVRSLEKGDKVSYKGRSNIAIKNLLENFVLLLLATVGISIITEFGDFAIKILVLYSIIGWIPHIIRYFISKSDGDNIKRRNLYRSTTAFIFILEIVVIMILLSSGIFNYEYKSKDVISNKVDSITIEDLGYKIKNKENTYIEEKNGLFANLINYRVESNAGYMRYELFTSKYSWAIDCKFKSKFNILRKLDIKYDEVETNLSDEGIKIYSNQYGNSIIIVSDEIYFDIGFGDEDLRNSDILEIVLEKIFKVKSV